MFSFVLPSTAEGMPTVILEAMSSGCARDEEIATGCGGLAKYSVEKKMAYSFIILVIFRCTQP